MLRRAKEAGLAVTAAASVNHLTLNEIDIGAVSHLLQGVAAAARRRGPRALVQALSEGLLDVVMSDHNPQDVETKRLPFAEAAPGAIGLETMLAAGAAPRAQRRDEARDAAQGDVDAAGRTARPARRHAQARQPRRRDRRRYRRALGARSGPS